MSVKTQINEDLKNAMRAGDAKKRDTLRLITAAIKQIEVDERIDIDENRMMIILDKLAKQRRESISQFQAAARDDLVAQEQYELDLIGHYLPTQLSAAEISTLIQQALAATEARGMSDMGKVMAHLKPLLQGRADLAQVSSIVKTKLAE